MHRHTTIAVQMSSGFHFKHDTITHKWKRCGRAKSVGEKAADNDAIGGRRKHNLVVSGRSQLAPSFTST